MPEINGETNVIIRLEQWIQFWNWIEQYTPSSEKESLFIERWLQQEDSLNEHWLWNFRNVLCVALGLNALGKTIHTSAISSTSI